MNGNFSASGTPIAKQSVLTSQGGFSGNSYGAYISAINGKRVSGRDSYGMQERFVLSSGKYNLSLSYSRSGAQTNALRVYMMGYDEDLWSLNLNATNDYPVEVEFLPGRYYEVVGGDWMKYSFLQSNSLAYAIIDFTTKDLKVVWTTNEEFSNQVIKERGSIYITWKEE